MFTSKRGKLICLKGRHKEEKFIKNSSSCGSFSISLIASVTLLNAAKLKGLEINKSLKRYKKK